MLSNFDQNFLKGSQLAILLASYTQLPKGLSCCLFQGRECPVLASKVWCWSLRIRGGYNGSNLERMIPMTRSNTTIILGLQQQ